MRFLCVLSVVCSLAAPAFALDREAFTFTKYDLNVRIEPEQQRLGVRGTITLRNDSSAAQKNLALQISSSLSWRSIRLAGKPAQFVSQPYTSDIDHTGELSEAIVSLPQEIAPKGAVELEIGYEGIIPLDATRLTQIGVPKEQAQHTDWDQIGESFTAVRGVGYVVWYPVAMEAAELSDGESVFETLNRWKLRNSDASMSLLFESTADETILFGGNPDLFGTVIPDPGILKVAAFSIGHFGVNVPAFAMGKYQRLSVEGGLSSVDSLPGHEADAKTYSDLLAGLASSVFAGVTERIQVVQLADPDASAFATENMLLAPFRPITVNDELTLVYALGRQCFHSQRTWIQEGFAHYQQASYIEHRDGRKAALEFLGLHLAELVSAEKNAGANSTGAPAGAPSSVLASAPDNVYAQTKAMYVWWMLRDMIGGDGSFAVERHLYRASDGEGVDNLPQFIQKQIPSRDLAWFFDDWVYHDRGLPDFRVDSVYPTQTTQGAYLVTVTIENLGGAGAEVPVTIRGKDSEVTKRLEVHGKSKNSFRVVVPSLPEEVVVNDGSVPESDMSNNEFKVQPAAEAH